MASGALGGVADAYKANEGGTDADVWNDKTTLARIGAGAGSHAGFFLLNQALRCLRALILQAVYL